MYFVKKVNPQILVTKICLQLSKAHFVGATKVWKLLGRKCLLSGAEYYFSVFCVRERHLFLLGKIAKGVIGK